jgi:virulence-associated protein VagC
MGLLKETEYSYYNGNDFGGYQFISLDHIINNFMIAYVGEGKIIPKIKRTDVAFHAQRAIQELSYDTFRSNKSQEIEVPPSLTMTLPQDYVNYVKIVWIDGSGMEHIMYPATKTSNPRAIKQNADGSYIFNNDTTLAEQTSPNSTSETHETQSFTTNTISLNDSDGNIVADISTVLSIGMEMHGTDSNGNDIPPGTYITGFHTTTLQVAHINQDIPVGTYDVIYTKGASSNTWENYRSGTPHENQDDYIDDTYWPNLGGRIGLDPTRAQSNGSFFIDEMKGKIHFSSNVSGNTVILKYISDGLGTDGEMIVHKFAEEAMYKCIAYAILSTTIAGQALAPSFQQQKSAAVRTAKLRLSNLKIEELTQIMRGKSKFIKH